MPTFLTVTLFALTLVAPAITAVLVWASKPKTIERLAVLMSAGPLVAILVHIGFVTWLFSVSPPRDSGMWILLGGIWFMALVVTGVAISSLYESCTDRFVTKQVDEAITNVTPIKKRTTGA